ncbi:MAG: bifunctional oligoribonuclease/PAP phosphatase NrnA [Sedimentisphaerales bacterium]|nr:bifunctional oligoribonuclease/PAP phosphatase NrnA [Sedimentisphaerales bacterium]
MVRYKAKGKYHKLVSLLDNKQTLLIVMQDNPDPDAMACAVGLRKLANNVSGTRCTIAHGGMIGRGENRALAIYLNVKLFRCEDIDFEKFDLIAMVDAQPGAGNSSLPEEIVPDIVIDHHPIRNATRSARFFDVRSKYGATATIILEYLKHAEVKIDIKLATALLYGIRSDTQDLGRDATKADIKAIEYLYPFANKRMLSEILRGSVPKEYFGMLSDALRNAVVYKSAVITHLGNISNPDMIGEMADLLLREDETFWTMCTGIFQGKMLVSIRTLDDKISAEVVMKSIVKGYGTGGGHPAYAGGQISLGGKTKLSRKKLEEMIQERFLRTVGIRNRSGKKLI